MFKKYLFLMIFLGLSSSLFSEDASFWLKMANRYLESRETQLAELSLHKALELEPKNLEARKMLESLLDSSKSSLEQRFDQIQKEASNINQDNLVVIEELDKSQDLQAKIDIYEDRLKNSVLNEAQKQRIKEILARLYFDIGIKYVEKSLLRQAIDSFERSVFYDKTFQLNLYELGYLYFQIRELQKGIQNLEEFINLQPNGVLAQNVRETLLDQYIKIARKHYLRKDFDSCLPVLKKIMAFAPNSAESQQARVFLMDLYFYTGIDNLNLANYEGAAKAFYEAMITMQIEKELDTTMFSKLAQNAIIPFTKYAQHLFLIEKDYDMAYTYFKAISWLVPGSAESFLAKEYIKEISKINDTVKNPVTYISNLVEEESKKYLSELNMLQEKRRLEAMRQ